MRIMCDTNVLLDVLLDRAPFADASAEVLALCENRTVEGFVSASCVTDIFYLVRKQTRNTNLAYHAVGKLLEILRVCSVTEKDVSDAFLQRARDFEDCLVATCAKSIGCDVIVSRNKKDFEAFGLPVLSPAELLQQL